LSQLVADISGGGKVTIKKNAALGTLTLAFVR
jgi:hypothetical protein